MSKIASFDIEATLHTCVVGGKQEETDAKWHVGIWQISGGGVEIEIEVGTVEFPKDNCGVVNSWTNVQIFNMLSTESIKEAVARGYLICPSNCASPNTTTVWLSSCVQRTGSGTSTAFSACTTGICRRNYTVCGSSVSPTMTLTGSTTDGCSSGGCGGTCPP